MNKQLLRAALAVAGSLILTGAANAALHYRIHDLGTVDDAGSYATGINNAGYILGYGALGRAVLISPTGERTYLPRSAGSSKTTSYKINDLGQAVFTDSTTWTRATIWTGGSTVTEIPRPSGYLYNRAYDINNSGLVVGEASNMDYDTCSAYTWSEAGGLTKLNPLAGFTGSVAFGVNDLGQVVGLSSKEGPIRRACLWEADGTVRDIGVFDGEYAIGHSINDKGQVVGSSTFCNWNATHAFVWTETGGMLDLGTLTTRIGSYAGLVDINDNGLAVGYSSTARDFEEKAIYWTKETGLVALPGLSGSDYSHAAAVNDAGWIVGISRAGNYMTPGAKLHMVAWEPVPEPSSILALIFGLGSLTTLAKRSRK